MKVEKKEDPKYSIKQLTRTISNGTIQFTWNFVSGSHFLIVLAAGIEGSNIEKVAEVVERIGDQLKPAQYIEDDGNYYIMLPQQKYKIDKRFVPDKLRVPRIGKVPYQFRVYPCDVQEDSIDIYDIRSEENVSAIPVNLFATVKEKTGLFSSKKKCTIELPIIDGYVNGLICYKPSCSRYAFPIPEKCLGREITVMLDKDDSLNLVVGEAYRQYYTIRM